MRRLALLATVSLIAPAAYAAAPAPTPCPTGAPSYAAADGGFGVLDGQWYSPGGSVWVPHGINVMEGNEPSAADILAADPGTNFVRLALYGFPDPSTIKSVVDDYTSHGMFVLLDQHSSSDGQNRGGGTGSIFTGAMLQQDLAWYAAMGKAFANNPYVGAASTNEPPAGDPAALSDWQLAEYNAFRQAGNNNPFWLEANAWADVNSINQGYKASDYAKMTNVGWDFHIYPWLFDPGANASQDQAKIAQYVANTRKITSADGIMPVNSLEYGNSTTGTNIDSNWQPVVQAIIDSGIGGAAWAWGNGGPGDGLQNPGTNYGAMVAGYNANSGSTGCVESPIATPVTTPTTADKQTVPLGTSGTATAGATGTAAGTGTDATTAGGSLSVADVAQLADQRLTASGQSVSDVAQLATTSASGADPGGVLPSNAQTATTSAGGSVASVQPIVRTVAAPTGTMPTPDAVSTSGSFSMSGDFGVMAAPASNNTATISGTGNSVNATGGIQAVTITGPGNTLSTGPYDDTITVQSSGNTIDAGGGSDTIVLAYNGKTPSSTINQDAPAVAPIGSAGNTIILPPPGTGTVTIQGALAANDRLDLSKALVGTTWDHNPATIWHYVDAVASSQGCILSVGGKVIALIPNGSPNGNIGPFVVAH